MKQIELMIQVEQISDIPTLRKCKITQVSICIKGARAILNFLPQHFKFVNHNISSIYTLYNHKSYFFFNLHQNDIYFLMHIARLFFSNSCQKLKNWQHSIISQNKQYFMHLFLPGELNLIWYFKLKYGYIFCFQWYKKTSQQKKKKVEIDILYPIFWNQNYG